MLLDLPEKGKGNEKTKKMTSLFKNIQTQKDNNSKFFKVERNDNNINANININTNFLEKENNCSHLFKTHKEKNNNYSTSTNCTPKKNSDYKNTPMGSNMFITIHENKESFENHNNIILIPRVIDEVSEENKNNHSKVKSKQIKDVAKNNVIDKRLFHKKLNMVYLDSIVQLVLYLNRNFNVLFNNYEKIINLNEFLFQMNQSILVLNKKIFLLKKQKNFCTTSSEKFEKEPLIKLRSNLDNMNKILENYNISHNFIELYSNISYLLFVIDKG